MPPKTKQLYTLHDSSIIRIGTRSSSLALWQANHVQHQLRESSKKTTLVPIENNVGDVDTVQPLYEMGIQGLFTKALDIALLNDKIDIAVHSLKDVPTILPKGLHLAMIPARGPHMDMVVLSDENNIADVDAASWTIASSSLRRRAQWLRKYPTHQMVNIRGNVQTRIRKAKETVDIDGTIIADAGIRRLDLSVSNVHSLPWMIPAAAQGALGIVCREDDTSLVEHLRSLSDENTFLACTLERAFLRHLNGGCSTAIGAHASIQDDRVKFTAGVFSDDGKEAITASESFSIETAFDNIAIIAEDMLKKGALQILSNKSA